MDICDVRLAARYEEPETFDQYFDVGPDNSSDFDFLLCWDDFSLHDSLPPQSKLTDTFRWKVWHYTEKEPDIQNNPGLSLQIANFHEAVLEACDLAPPRVHDRVGNLCQFGCWAKALLWLSIKRAHPMLLSYGTSLPFATGSEVENLDGEAPPKKPKKANPFLEYKKHNNLTIHLEPPKLVQATAYAFNYLRHIATSDVSANGLADDPKSQQTTRGKATNDADIDKPKTAEQDLAKTPNRKRRKYKTRNNPEADAKLWEDWQAANGQGVQTVAEYCRRRGLDEKDTRKAFDRHRKRAKPQKH